MGAAGGQTGQQPAEAEIRAQLARILESTTFRSVKRLRNLLSFLVGATLAGRARELKEYTLATEALGRGASFDPRIDPIARVEASRLRGRLEHYYATEGLADPVVLSLPKGGYAPLATFAQPKAGVAAPASARPGWAWLVAGATLLLVMGGGFGWLARGRPVAAETPQVRVDMALGAPGVLAHQAGSAVVISPDGGTVVMILLQPDGAPRLFARKLSSLDAVELPGTAGADAPFFSPDGKWVGFYAGAKLKKTSVDGSGSPVVIADAPDFLGAAWMDNGDIVLAPNRRNAFQRIPASGGKAELLADYGGAGVTLSTPRWEEALPDGKGILFSSGGWGPDTFAIEFVRADGSGRKVVLKEGVYPRYAKSGHLLYVDRGALFAVKFDIDRAETIGEPWPVLSDVAHSEGFGFADYDIADNGTLVYWRQPGAGASVIHQITADGSTPLVVEPGRYLFPRVSPDGRKLAYASGDGGDMDLWIYDMAARSKVRVQGAARTQSFPLWTPDGRFLLSMDDAWPGILAINGDGTGKAQRLLPGVNIPFSTTPDGSRVAYYKMGVDTVFDLWTAPLSRDAKGGLAAGEPELFRQTPFVETYPAFSPNGKWIAYASNESGWFEVYVRAFPDTGSGVKVSSNGGRVAAWTPTHIYYSTSDQRIMSAAWRVEGGRFQVDPPKQWTQVRLADTGVLSNYSMSPDGKVAVGLVWPGPQIERGNRLTVVQDVFAELRRGPR
ncbi:MAG TPA: hypothetical protein VGO52_17500 [Hyphomonadaceae bacterium]|nr:hypothetical protein [Hyphomonadaceae bacterium]